jgi:hypothetical protein
MKTAEARRKARAENLLSRYSCPIRWYGLIINPCDKPFFGRAMQCIRLLSFIHIAGDEFLLQVVRRPK